MPKSGILVVAALIGLAYVAWLGLLLVQQAATPLDAANVSNEAGRLRGISLQAAAISRQAAVDRPGAAYVSSAAEMLRTNAAEIERTLTTAVYRPDARTAGVRTAALGVRLGQALDALSRPGISAREASVLARRFAIIASELGTR